MVLLEVPHFSGGWRTDRATVFCGSRHHDSLRIYHDGREGVVVGLTGIVKGCPIAVSSLIARDVMGISILSYLIR